MLVNSESAAGLFFGYVTAVDYKTCRIRVRLDDRDDVETWWVHVPQKNTHANRYRHIPDMGAHVAVMLAGNGVDGLYMGSIYSSAEPPPIDDDSRDFVRFADGTVISYDTAQHELVADCVGDITVTAANTITVTADKSVTVTAPVVGVVATKSAAIDTPETTITGNATILKKLSVLGGLAVSGGSGAAAKISGNMEVDGNLHGTGSILADGPNANHHSHP